MSDDELVARVNMADAKFSFQEKGKMYHPAWIAPEVMFVNYKRITPCLCEFAGNV